MTDQLRIGIIGIGSWALSNHVSGIARRDDAVLVAACRKGAAELELIQREHDIPLVTEDYRELLAADLDAVIVASPHTLHYEHARAALDRGLHVLCEKPLALHAEQAWDLVRAAADNAVQLMVPLGWNLRPYLAQAREFAAELGTIEHVVVQMASPTRGLFTGTGAYTGSSDLLAPDPRTWADPQVAGGGYGYGQLTHALGLALNLVPLRAQEVSAQVANREAAVDLFDAVSVRFDNGATGVVSGAGTVPAPLGWQLDVRVFGDRGMLLLDLEVGRERIVLHTTDGQTRGGPLESGAGDYDASNAVDVFVEVATGRRPNVESPGELSARVTELLDGAYRSAAQGGPVRVAATADQSA